MNNAYLRDVNLSDARFILESLGDHVPEASLSPYSGKKTLSGMENYLRQLKNSPQFEGFIWEEEEPKRKPYALIFKSQTPLRSGTVQIEFLLSQALEEDYQPDKLIENILTLLAKDHEAKIIHFHIPKTYKSLNQAISKISKEVEVASYSISSNRQEDDSWIEVHTFNKLTNWPYTWVFVPSVQGLLAIYGNEQEVTLLDWFDYNKKIEDGLVRDLCVLAGYANSSGILQTFEHCNEVFRGVDGERKMPWALVRARQELAEYLAGERQVFTVPTVTKTGTSFQRAVWSAIDEIPYGSSASYEDIGTIVSGGDRERGRKLTRVVGAACGANPLPIFTPCHRVIAKDGKLQGYAYGVKKKDYLLSLEIMGRSKEF